MTGIVASMADAAVLHAPGLVGTGLLALAMFILGAVVCALVFNWGRVNGLRSRYANILLLEGVGMLVFGLLAEHVRDAHRPLVVVAVLCFTMGLQNALITRIGAWPIRTTHVTGMVTDIGVELGKILYRNGPGAAAPSSGNRGAWDCWRCSWPCSSWAGWRARPATSGWASRWSSRWPACCCSSPTAR